MPVQTASTNIRVLDDLEEEQRPTVHNIDNSRSLVFEKGFMSYPVMGQCLANICASQTMPLPQQHLRPNAGANGRQHP